MSRPRTLRLPPLATLQAFEAAVRHQSYTRAAEELHLTHGAISRHVATLQRRTGQRLFVRERQAMLPTPAARLLVTELRQALAMLERSFARELPTATRRRITLSVLPTWASRWLVPRLADFAVQLPDLDLTLDIRMDPADLDAGEADCAVRFGAGGWKNVPQLELHGDEQFPVCAPHFRGGDLPRNAEELVRSTLLSNPWLPWEPWLDAAGVDGSPPHPSLIFTDSSVLLDAAVAGLGVAMARASLVESDLRSGRLVRLGSISVRDPYRFWFVWRPEHPRLNDLMRVGDWLRQQAAGVRALHSAPAPAPVGDAV